MRFLVTPCAGRMSEPAAERSIAPECNSAGRSACERSLQEWDEGDEQHARVNPDLGFLRICRLPPCCMWGEDNLLLQWPLTCNSSP
ncbi:unnamed protein product [Mycena citricolor]|uniref:Uncharacterized protein n=1 Tax=Mycena citricolor TaxID=2018698 RepID=A0AAD2K751_9AGAR|nr:unnamed protein product [Mycena citricolor]